MGSAVGMTHEERHLEPQSASASHLWARAHAQGMQESGLGEVVVAPRGVKVKRRGRGVG